MKVLKRDKRISRRKRLTLFAALLLTISASLWGCQRAPESGTRSSSSQAESTPQPETDSTPDQEVPSEDGGVSAPDQKASLEEDGDSAPGQKAPSEEEGGSASGPVVFSDSLGRQVTVYSPKRVAAMI